MDRMIQISHSVDLAYVNIGLYKTSHANVVPAAKEARPGGWVSHPSRSPQNAKTDVSILITTSAVTRLSAVS